MPIKKRAPTFPVSPEEGVEAGPRADQPAAFEAAVTEFAAALDLLRKDQYAAAQGRFDDIEVRYASEPELAERCRTYSRICAGRMTLPRQAPVSARDCYHQAVVESNMGNWDEAIQLFDRAFRMEPSAEILYARAGSWALRGASDKAIADLRDAIAMNPAVRFQAVNDPDFERIREEPTFINIIEPTSAGA